LTLLSIVIPVYNERNTVREIVRCVEAVSLSGIGKEIILALEPEPGCVLESTEDAIRFFEQMEFPDTLEGLNLYNPI